LYIKRQDYDEFLQIKFKSDTDFLNLIHFDFIYYFNMNTLFFFFPSFYLVTEKSIILSLPLTGEREYLHILCSLALSLYLHLTFMLRTIQIQNLTFIVNFGNIRNMQKFISFSIFFYFHISIIINFHTNPSLKIFFSLFIIFYRLFGKFRISLQNRTIHHNLVQEPENHHAYYKRNSKIIII